MKRLLNRSYIDTVLIVTTPLGMKILILDKYKFDLHL